MTRALLHQLVDRLPDAELASAGVALELLLESDHAQALANELLLEELAAASHKARETLPDQH